MISLQPARHCSISWQYTMQKIFTKLQTTFQNEERNDEKELLLLKNIFQYYVSTIPRYHKHIIGKYLQPASS